MKIALAPVNVILGDWEGNLKIHRARVAEAAKLGAELVAFPELSLVGYSPLDLMSRPSWAGKAKSQLDSLHSWLKETHPKLAVIVGTSLPVEAQSLSPRGLANCAVFLHGDRREIRAKTLLPDYDVFHEARYFDSAAYLDESFRAPIEFGQHKLGLLICEDSWEEMELRGKRIYRLNPTERLKQAGCNLLINISASPFDRTKRARRRSAIASDACQFSIPMAYVNHYGGQDELLFDGDCFLLGPDGEPMAKKREATPSILMVESDRASKIEQPLAGAELRAVREMVVAGIRDYARKNGFERAVLGLSGGIDSALVAMLACEALGPANVIALVMPSKFSSVHSIEDAEAFGTASGLQLRHYPIKMLHSTIQLGLKPFFADLAEDTTEENIQSRLRGTVVMAFANKFRALALATGNKSELAMGYCTLYGDMCGALAPIGDLYKTEVYELARFMNEEQPWIPERTFTKPPSAELRPNQKDQDSLPPYDLLDAALRLLVDFEQDADAALSFLKNSYPQADLALIERLQRTVRLNEYKRRQGPPVLKLSARAFGPGRMMPLTCQF